MKRLYRTLQIAATLSLLISLVLTSTAFAITITIDGQKDAAWDGSGGQTPGIQADPDEAGINNHYDTKEVRWTNDSLSGAPYGHMYFLLESYDNFDANYPPLEPSIIICIDVDNNTATGQTVSGYCNDMPGVDRRINVTLWAQSVLVWRWTGTSFVIVAMPPGGMRSMAYYDPGVDGLADLPYIEIGVDLQSLGITSNAQCISAMPAAIYYDNGIGDSEDTTPATGTFNIGCGNPTAITLQSAGARSAGRYVLPLLIGAAVLALGGVGGLLVVRRRKA